MKRLLILLLAATAALASGAAGARSSVHFGIGIGVPLGWGYPYYPYYPPYYYDYEPRTIVVPAQPQRYIEQSSPDSGYWYYCADSKAYYPYVKDCPGGWQRVSPTPQR
jgi:hypothetical protein